MPRKIIYLIGSMNNQILGSKLPTLRDCMEVLFFNMRIVKMNLSESAYLAIDECIIFWKKARIPIKDRADCMKKLKKSYELWRTLDKHKERKSETYISQIKEFEKQLDSLFDIAHANTFDIMKIEIDKEFLRLQRMPGRPGCLLGVDMHLMKKEKRQIIRKNKEATKRQKYEAELSNIELGNY